MRALVYYVATTLDGFIAKEDGSFGDFPWNDEFGADLLERFPETFPAHLREGSHDRSGNRQFDAVLMGRRTYEVGLSQGVTCPYPTLDQYVFSRSMPDSPDPNVKLVRENSRALVGELKAQRGKAIWICGGCSLATHLYEADLVDRLIIKLNPVVFGSGIPVLAAKGGTRALTLTDHRAYPSGHVLLTYDVPNGQGSAHPDPHAPPH